MKRIITILIIVAVLAVGGYFGLRAFQKAQAAAAGAFQTAEVTRGDLTVIVGATGSVRANQSGVIAWQTTGRIGEITVKVGDQVKAGQTLARLDPRNLPQSIILARADLVNAQRELDNLLHSNTASAQAYQNLVAAQKELEDAQDKRASLQYARTSRDTIEVARANLALAEDEVKKAQEFYDQVANRPENDLLRAQALSALADAKKKRDRNKANLEYLIGKPDELEVAEADARVKMAEARLADAQREWERLKDGPDKRDIEAAQARVAAIQSTLDQVDLEAPFAGTVTEVRSKPGDEVTPGAISFRIDDLSHLLVDVQVTEVDINRISVGQKARLTFDAIQGKEYEGQVTEVGQVGTNVQGVVNFTVTVELLTSDSQVRPGMTAAVNLVTDELKDVVLVPNRAVRLRNGKRVVYLLKNGLPEVTEIRLGSTSDQYSQVLEGVKPGDVLVLNPPTEFQAGPRGGFGN